MFNPVGLILGLLVAQQFVLKKLQSASIEDFNSLDEARKILIRTSDLMVIRIHLCNVRIGDIGSDDTYWN